MIDCLNVIRIELAINCLFCTNFLLIIQLGLACMLIIHGQILRIDFECPTYMFVPFFFLILRIDFEWPTCYAIFSFRLVCTQMGLRPAPPLDVDLGHGCAARSAPGPEEPVESPGDRISVLRESILGEIISRHQGWLAHTSPRISVAHSMAQRAS